MPRDEYLREWRKRFGEKISNIRLEQGWEHRERPRALKPHRATSRQTKQHGRPVSIDVESLSAFLIGDRHHRLLSEAAKKKGTAVLPPSAARRMPAKSISRLDQVAKAARVRTIEGLIRFMLKPEDFVELQDRVQRVFSKDMPKLHPVDVLAVSLGIAKGVSIPVLRRIGYPVRRARRP